MVFGQECLYFPSTVVTPAIAVIVRDRLCPSGEAIDFSDAWFSPSDFINAILHSNFSSWATCLDLSSLNDAVFLQRDKTGDFDHNLLSDPVP